MKTLWDIIQTILLVTVIGGIFVAIPILGVIIAIVASIALIYAILKDSNPYV